MKWSKMHKFAISIVGIFVVACLIFIIKVASVNSSNIVPTSDEASQIMVGMSYGDVKNIMGCDGRIVKEDGTPGSDGYSVVYAWGAPGAEKTISVTFGNNGSTDIESTGLGQN